MDIKHHKIGVSPAIRSHTYPLEMQTHLLHINAIATLTYHRNLTKRASLFCCCFFSLLPVRSWVVSFDKHTRYDYIRNF